MDELLPSLALAEAQQFPIYPQMQNAVRVAESHGYKNVSITQGEGKGHERLNHPQIAPIALISERNQAVRDLLHRADLIDATGKKGTNVWLRSRDVLPIRAGKKLAVFA